VANGNGGTALNSNTCSNGVSDRASGLTDVRCGSADTPFEQVFEIVRTGALLSNTRSIEHLIEPVPEATVGGHL